MRRRDFLATSAAAALAVACGTGRNDASGDVARAVIRDDGTGPLRLGALYPLSGPAGPHGAEEYQGVVTAVEFVNAAGGIGGAMGGRQVELVTRDVPDLDTGWEASHDLISSQRLPLLVGTYSSIVALATTQAAADNNVVYWENGSVADLVISRGLPNVYRTGPSSAVLAGQAVDFIAQRIAPGHGLEPTDIRLGLVYESGPYGGAVGTRARAVAAEYGIEVVADIPYDPFDEDFATPMQVLEQAQPNVVIATTYLDDGVRFVRAIRAADLDLLAVVGKCAAFFTPEFATMLEGQASGLFLSDKSMQVLPGGLRPEAAELAERFDAAYRARWNESPTASSYTGFAGTWLLLTEVLSQVARVEPDTFRTAVAGIEHDTGWLPNGAGVKFAPEGHPFAGQNLRALGVVWQWQGDTPALVFPDRFATGTPDYGLGRV